MTSALLASASVPGGRPDCPVWCTNETPLVSRSDPCDAGLGERNHLGRVGCVVLPSRVDAYYDQEIGVELFRSELTDGTVTQLSVLITYSCEMQEIGHVCLDLDETRQLLELTRTDLDGDECDPKHRQVRFCDLMDNNILTERPVGFLPCNFVMNVEGRTRRMSLHRTQLSSLGDLLACACVLAEVSR